MHGNINTHCTTLAATVGLVLGTRDPKTDPWCSPDGDTTGAPRIVPFANPSLSGASLYLDRCYIRPGCTDNLQ